MFAQWREEWNWLRRQTPGERFQAFYQSRQERRQGSAVTAVVAFALLLVGAVMLVIPGPGLLVMALGFALLASQSQGLARRLDGLELRLRRLRH